jgi:membrane protein required for colicin V production
VILLGSLIRFVVGKFLKITGLSIFDHALGAVFGAARGGLIAVALITGMMAFAKDGHPPDAILHSRIAPYMVSGGKVAAAIAPHELNQGFDQSYQAARSAWNSAVEHASRQAIDEKRKK